MFETLIAFSLRQRALVLAGTVALVAAGIFAAVGLPVDAVPDVTNNQVQVLTQAPALSPVEVERAVSVPVELALKSVPGVVEMRSLSRQGISVVTVVFRDNVETYFARQQLLEALRETDLPEGVGTPALGPVTTGLGEILRYTLRDTTGARSAMELRTLQDWIVRRQLLGVPGLAEVNTIGGELKQYQVSVDPDRLAAYGLTLREVFDAAAEASGSAGAATIETGPEQLAVRTDALVGGIADLEAAVVATRPGGLPVTLGDVADIALGPAIRFGAATQDGTGEVVTGFTMQLKGANARVVTAAVKSRIAEIQAGLPDGVIIEPYYDRTELVDRTLATVARNLAEGALLVVVVLLLLLANLRAGLILASVIPLSMLFAVVCMRLTDQSGNLMSLGAIDFGLVVDASLIVVENVLRRISDRQKEGGVFGRDSMKRLTYGGAVEVLTSAKFGVFIIILVYVPIMALQGIEGKLFRPMALTVAYALVGSLLLAVTYVPVMCSLFLRIDRPVKHSPIITVIQRHYGPVLARVMRHRVAVIGASAVLFVLSVVGLSRLGAEFIPRLDEGDLAVQIIRLPSVSLTESLAISAAVERRLMAFPEVRTVVGNTGRAEISTDPMGVETTDAYVILKPRGEWTSGRTKADLVEAMEEAVQDVPAGVQFYQPIEMRTNELVAGARGDVVVKLFGDDVEALTPVAEQVAAIVRATPGAADVTLDQTTGAPQLVVTPDRAALARYGLTVAALNRIVETAVGGATAGEVVEGERRFDVVVRFAAAARRDPTAIRALPVVTPTGARVPLSALATVEVTEGPASVSREDGSRFVAVSANVRGRDVASFVGDVQAQVAARVDLPAGTFVAYGGAFENLRAASRRLALVVPVALLLILGLLVQTFGSLRLGLVIALCVPMAVIGGVAALALAGLPFSISAAVGFIALFGVAVLNGIVMVAAFRAFEAAGLDRDAAVLAGADARLRAVVTTATLAALGFVPMLLAHGAGAEVQRPLATVVIGGLVTSTLLTLFVLPTVYAWIGGPRARPADVPDIDFLADEVPDVPRVAPAGTSLALPILVLLLAATSAGAQTGMSFPDALDRAEAVAPELRGGAASIAREAARRESAGILPATEFFLGIDRVPTIDGSFSGAETSVGASQSFRLPGYYRAQRGAAGALLLQSEAERESVRRGVRLRAALAYVEAVAAAERLALADSSAGVARRFARASARRQELGATGALEPLQAEVALAQAERARAQALGDANAARITLATLLATRDVTLADSLGHGPFDADLPADLDAALDVRLAQNPRVLAAEAAILAAQADARAIRTERLVSFGAEAALQTEGGRVGFLGGRIGVAVPLSRLATDAPDRAASAAVAVAQAGRDGVLVGLAADLRARVARLRAAQAQVALYDARIVPQAEQAYAIAIRLRREGAATYLEVLQAQTALLQTRADALDVRLDAARLRTEIDALIDPSF